MNILLISPLPPPAGGIATWTKRYSDSEKSKEHNIFVVNTAVKGKRVKEFTKRNLIDEVRRTWSIILNLNDELSKNKIDIVHLNSPCGKFGIIRDYICARIVRKNNIKLVTHFRCDVSFMIKGKLELFFFKKLIELTDLVLTLNKVSERFIFENCNKNTITVPNFIPDEYLEMKLSDKKFRKNVTNILFAGHIVKTKGCDLIYEVAEKFPDIRFVLAGYISEEFKEKLKPSNIILLGEISTKQVRERMLEADIFLFPTHTEGFPNVITEAMACGLPIISTPVGAIPDMLEDKGGIIVDVNSVNATIKAINTLQDINIRKQMSYWNKSKVQSAYTINSVMDRLFELYLKIIKGDV